MSETRRVGVLAAAQVAGGVGAAVGIAAGSLLAARVTGGTALAGTAQTATVLGAALLAVPLARLAERLGRRTALSVGLLVAVAGSGLVVLAATTGSFVLLLLGAALFGGGSASGLQARYAATDGLPAGRRGRALSTVVWATTVGAVAGPNLAAPAARLDQALGLPTYSGSYLVAAGAFLVAALVLLVGLPGTVPAVGAGPATARPDPPPAAGGGTSVLAVLRTVWARPSARLGVVALGTAHAVMVGVMVMTPVHLDAHGASFTVVGLVISVHVAGMYAASPLFGWLADRRGATAGTAVGVALLLAALAVAGTSGTGLLGPGGTSGTGLLGPGAPSHAGVGLGLLLFGLGWSACLVAGSTLLAGTFDQADPRARTLQGASDLVMGGAGAAAGALSGPLVALTGYPGLTVAAVLPLGLTLWCLARVRAGERGAGGRGPAGLLYRRTP